MTPTRLPRIAFADSRRFAVSLLVFGMAAALLPMPSRAQPAPPPPPMGMEHGMPGGMRGMHGEMGGMGGMAMGGSPERMGRMIDRMLDGLNATDAQRAQIKQIAAAAATDMKAQRQAGRGMHMRAMQIFTAPTVDAGAAEQLRQQMSQQHEQASRRMTQAMVDIARVLTPEQRARIGERMRDRQARMDERQQRMQRERPGK